MTYRKDWAGLIQQYAPTVGVDPQAALAVASAEGLSGGVGDGGHAFGPFQLNDAGGVLTGRPGDHRSFAESPEGIRWALERIATIAKGKKGRQAIDAIVRRFERPAAPGAEIQRAAAAYGGDLGGGGFAPPAGAAPQQQGPDLRGLFASFQRVNDIVGLPSLDPGMLPAPQSAPAPTRPHPTPAQPAPVANGKPTLGFLEHFVAPYGVAVTSTTGGKHATHSYHYQGRAVDVGGPAPRMAAVAEAALQHPRDFKEMFYAGPGAPGYFIRNGRVFPNSQLEPALAAEHTNHVHLAA